MDSTVVVIVAVVVGIGLGVALGLFVRRSQIEGLRSSAQQKQTEPLASMRNWS